MRYKQNKRILYHCKYNVIWCTKYCKPILIDNAVGRLENIIKEVVNEKNAEIEKLEILEDRVNILVSIDPQYGIHRLIKRMKAKSSGILRKEFKWIRTRVPTLWSDSYMVTTVGMYFDSDIQKYIKTQKEK